MSANKHSISFQKAIPSCSLYLIILSKQIIGSIYMNEHNIITNIDINGDCFHIIKDMLIAMLLFELGLNSIELICDKIYQDYYEELGFKKLYTADNNRIILRYEAHK